MNKRMAGWMAFTVCTITAFVLVLAGYNIISLDTGALAVLRWCAIATLFIFGFYKNTLTAWIMISMVVGIEVGLDFKNIAIELKILSEVFLHLIKTIIAPILFATLVVGIAGHSNLKQVGRIGAKSLIYFEIVTTLALAIGLIAINISGAGYGITLPEGFDAKLPENRPKTWQEIIVHIFPENIIKSIYHADVLPIVVFSVLFGIALAMLSEERRAPMLHFCESLAETMFKFTKIIMYFAPLGVGGAVAYTVSKLGVGILVNLAGLLGTLYVGLFVFIGLVLIPVMLIFKIPVKAFLKAIYNPVSIAFATTSSESALPKAMENMEKLGVPRKIVAFVLPTGYSFNLDGTTLYLSMALIFVAQAAGIPVTIEQQIFMGLVLMLTSKGVAGVPRASTVILIGAAESFNLPLWPIVGILGIDALMDMARTSVNVIGNTLASCVIARSEGEFDDAKAAAFLDEK